MTPRDVKLLEHCVNQGVDLASEILIMRGLAVAEIDELSRAVIVKAVMAEIDEWFYFADIKKITF